MRDCPAFSQWQLGAANRGSSGSLAINDLSGAEPQFWRPGRLQTQLCPATDASAALDGRTPRTGARPAPRGLGAPWSGLVARAGRGPAGPRTRPQGDLPRDHLPLHIRPDPAHLGLQLAALSATRQEQTRLPRQEGRQSRKLHRRPCFLEQTAYRGRRSQCPRSLGSRPDDVLQIRSGDPDRARAHLAPAARHPHRQQARARYRPSSRPLVCCLAGRPVPDRYLRQWDRVRLSPGAAPPRDRDLLLRSARALAEGRHRECDRSDAPLHSTQNRSRDLPDAPPPPVDQRLQQHPAQMP
ncbi:hypothetical protein ACVMB0_001893 [Bradyrhizobium sp. USDA 4451]